MEELLKRKASGPGLMNQNVSRLKKKLILAAPSMISLAIHVEQDLARAF